MSITAKVIADSTNGKTRLITVQTYAPKFLDAEIEKHRMISSNSSSDRAVPVHRMIERPVFYPVDIRKPQPGMQGYESLSPDLVAKYNSELRSVIDRVKVFNSRWAEKIHKQTLNRNLLGWSMQDKIMTATKEEWDYFFGLRLNEMADPAIQYLARKIYDAISASEPERLRVEDWHLPYITEEDRLPLEVAKKCSVARCARVSYLNHDRSIPDPEKDIKLFDMLAESRHWSCFEHIATPMRQPRWYDGLRKWEDGVTHHTRDKCAYSGNFKGWIQYRKLLDSE